jgi:hypothetical protein
MAEATVGDVSGIREILAALASPLQAVGLTPGEFSEFARAAFVDAAAGICRLGNGRVNDSRIAVMTNLSRQEVARLRSAGGRKPSERGKKRTARILEGWRADPQFSSSGGKPRTLKLRAAPTSFHALVKRYGGDVPTRAVLEELKREKAVRLQGDRVVPVATTLRTRSKHARFLRLTAPLIASAIRALSKISASRSGLAFSARIFVKDDIEATLIQRKIEAALGAAFENFATLEGTQPRGKASVRTSKSINVCAFLELN